jgi:hypothetical protein
MTIPDDLPAKFPITTPSSSEGEYELRGQAWRLTANKHQYRSFHQGALVAYVDESATSDARTNAQRALQALRNFFTTI